MSESPYNDRTAGHYWVVFQGQQEVGTWAYINDAEGSGWGWFLPGFGNWFNDDELDSIGEQVIPDPVPGLRQQLEEARAEVERLKIQLGKPCVHEVIKQFTQSVRGYEIQGGEA